MTAPGIYCFGGVPESAGGGVVPESGGVVGGTAWSDGVLEVELAEEVESAGATGGAADESELVEVGDVALEQAARTARVLRDSKSALRFMVHLTVEEAWPIAA